MLNVSALCALHTVHYGVVSVYLNALYVVNVILFTS